MARLQVEFERAAERTPGLFHDLLYVPKMLPATAAEWDDFFGQNKTESSGSWEQWDVFPWGGCAADIMGPGTHSGPFLRLAATGRGLLKSSVACQNSVSRHLGGSRHRFPAPTAESTAGYHRYTGWR